MQDKPKIIVICGPTGSGKTGLAIELCKKFNGEIINADSRQVYKEMDIGTAKEDIKDIKKLRYSDIGSKKISQYHNISISKPSSAKHSIDGIPIHLIDIICPNKRYSVGQFKIDAGKAISDIINRGKVPFIVGGTGLYIDALVENFKFPMSNDKSMSKSKCQKISQYLNISISDLGTKSHNELVEILKNLDPDAIDIVDLKNRRRVERAIEVCVTTGIPFTKQRTKGEREYDVLKLAPDVSMDREKLYEKINKRVEEMIEEGLEKEVQYLAEKYGWDSEAMTGIGYREWRVRHSISNFSFDPELLSTRVEAPESRTEGQFPISNKISNNKFQITKDLDSIIEKIKQNTRNYAKRQITWFKRDREINYVDLKGAERLVKKFLNLV